MTTKKHNPKEISDIGRLISDIGRKMHQVERISVETQNYKVLVSSKPNPKLRVPSKLLPIALFLSTSILAIAINIMSAWIALIPDSTIRNAISIVIVVIGFTLGFWQYVRSRTE